MATCPRCGGTLERYELWGREQYSCTECGYVGVPVDHESLGGQSESWGDAIRRFRERDDESGPEVDAVAGSPEVPDETDTGEFLDPEVRREPGDVVAFDEVGSEAGQAGGSGAGEAELSETDQESAEPDPAGDEVSAESEPEVEQESAEPEPAPDQKDGEQTDEGGVSDASRRSALLRRRETE
jgi:hypothetical protein